MKDDPTKKEIGMVAEDHAFEKGFANAGEITAFACPECHAVLTRLQEDQIMRYRCNSGHTYSADDLLEAVIQSNKALHVSDETYRLELELEVRERIAEIKEQSHYIKRITETVPDMISVTNLQTREFEYLNRETFKAQGFDPAEMNAKSREELDELVHADDRPALKAYFQQFLTASDEDVVTAEYRARDDKGAWKWFLVRGRAFQRNETGAVTHLLNVIENITERKTAEQEVLRLKDEAAQKATDKYMKLYNAIDEAFCLLQVIYDDAGKVADMRFLDINPAVEKHTGVRVEIGKTFLDYCPHFNLDIFHWCQNLVQTGVPVRFTSFSKANGRWYEYHAVRIGNPEDNQVALLFNDITDLKRNEQNQALLAEISQELITLSTVEETFERLGEKLGSYFDVTQCMFFELTDDVEFATTFHGWSAKDAGSLLGTYRMKDFLSEEQLAACINGKTTVVNDTRIDTPGTAENYTAYNIRSFIINPLLRDHVWKFLISIIDNKPRQWRQDEIDLVGEIANRIWIRLERARTEEALRISEARLKTTMDSATGYAIITTDKDGIVQLWSSGAEKLFGYTEDEITGKSVEIIFTPEDRENNVPAKVMQTAKKTGKANDERWHLRKDGARFFASGVLAPIYNGSLTGYVKVARDSTERKMLEQQKDDFIAVASHELKTPVTSIKAYTELLMDIMGEEGKRDDLQLITKLDAQVDRLTELIRSLLDTTRISEGQLSLTMQEFDINALISERLDELRSTTEIHRLLFDPPGPLCITADRERIGQVLVNLVSNAIKYCHKGGNISIVSEAHKEGVQVSIHDTGVGIPAEIKNKIFDRFYRERNAQIETFPGMGLGLYIAAAILARHEGRIWVDSKLGEGSTFHFFLPYR